MSPHPVLLEVSQLFQQSSVDFWLAGGHSLDLFLGEKTREHDDIDIVIRRQDQLKFQNILRGWDLRAANPPGSATLVPWASGQYFELPVHNIWCRKNETSPWDVELLFSEFEGDEWVYRRTRSIRGPMESFGWKSSFGFLVLAPEIQLLYKSRNHRPKDLQDLKNCLPKLGSSRKILLKNWIAADSGPEHPWLSSL